MPTERKAAFRQSRSCSAREGQETHRSITFRLPLSLYDSLITSATANRRSANAELCCLLDAAWPSGYRPPGERPDASRTAPQAG